MQSVFANGTNGKKCKDLTYHPHKKDIEERKIVH